MSKDKLSKDIEDIKKLLILHILKSGAKSNEIRNILKMSGTEFKKLIPIKKIKRYT